MTEREKLEQAIAALESQRATLGDAVVETMLAAAREKLDALQEAVQVAPQRKQVTVLFADVSGLAAMSETMDAEEVNDIRNALWVRLDRAITTQGGMIDKHIGDAVMALFGAPTARENDPERAIRAALAMQNSLTKFRAAQQIDLAMRIGINTGPVLLGEVGTTAEYTAVGDTVNLASRLEHAAPVGSILISHNTYRHVRGIFSAEALEPIRVKGKTEPVQIYEVRGVKPRAFRVPTRGVEGVETRMVGRAAELEHLREALYTVMEGGKMRIVTVAGDAGMGKSRLLYEFRNWVELLSEEVLQFRARAGQQTSNIPYFLIRDLFASRFEIKNSDRPALAREKLEQGILHLMGAHDTSEDAASENARIQATAEVAAHFIGHLIGLDFSQSPYLRGILSDARQIRDRAFHYAAQFFAAATSPPMGGTEGGRPAALLLEDLHWADDGSLDLIEHLAQECRSMSLLIVALTRHDLFERRATWGKGQGYHTRLELRPLSKQNNRRLVEEILRKVEQVPPHLHDLIVERAAGSPFYTEELIKMLVEDGVIVKGEEHWRVASEQLAEMRVPPTLVGVLQARLDGLPQPERETLQRASVVGQTFWDGAVAWLNGKTVEALAALRDRELVFGRQMSTFIGEQEHIFKHAILHDVTYESVLKRQRREYHARVADWLTTRSSERIAEYAGLIGEHYERAGNEAKAAEWYARAARQAQDTFAPEAAIGYYQKALAFMPAETAQVCARQAELYEGLGLMLQWQARFEEAIEAYEAMRAAAEGAGDAVAQARAWDGMSTVQQLQGNYRAALEMAGRAEEIARSAGAPAQEILARALHNKGWVFSELGEAQAAFSLGEQALALSTELDDRRMMADSLNLLGRVQVNVGRYEQARRHIEQALALARELDDRMWVARMLNNLGVIAESRGDYQAAAENYREALTIARETGNRHGEIVVLNNLGEARVGLGEYRTAEADLRQAIEMAEAAGWGGVSATYCSLAKACLGLGKLTEAVELARRALELGQETEVQEDIGGAWYALGMTLAAATSPGFIAVGKDTLDAAGCFARGLAVFAEAGMEGERARTLRAWAEYEIGCGDKERGEKMLQEAQEIFERLRSEA